MRGVTELFSESGGIITNSRQEFNRHREIVLNAQLQAIL